MYGKSGRARSAGGGGGGVRPSPAAVWLLRPAGDANQGHHTSEALAGLEDTSPGPGDRLHFAARGMSRLRGPRGAGAVGGTVVACEQVAVAGRGGVGSPDGPDDGGPALRDQLEDGGQGDSPGGSVGRRKKPLRIIGIDEVSRKKGHRYLTLVWARLMTCRTADLTFLAQPEGTGMSGNLWSDNGSPPYRVTFAQAIAYHAALCRQCPRTVREVSRPEVGGPSQAIVRPWQ